MPRKFFASALFAIGVSICANAQEVATAPVELQGTVDAIAKEVAQIRGLPFKRGVPAERQSTAQFQEYLRRKIDEVVPASILLNYGRIVRTLGLYRGPAIDDYSAMMTSVMGSQAGAYYDPKQQRFYVLMSRMPELMQGVLYSHELYHALQDQHFDLSRFLEPAGGKRVLDSDQAMARQAVVEGEATYVMNLWALQKAMKSIPPREMRQQAPKNDRHIGKIKIVVDEIDCQESKLIIGTAKPDKDPKEFDLQRILMHNVGPNDPWQYDANLVNAIPKGDIHAKGTFGPWVNESPGDSSLTGQYTFDHADLGTIKGIGGILSSTGEFSGQLNRIVVDGVTETPDFSLDTANNPVPLHTRFHAIVDGTSGDTYLQPVEAKLLNSEFTSSGAIVNVKGKGHIIDLDVNVPNGRIQDFLELAVKTKPPIMTGRLNMKTKLHIRPGEESVTQKLSL